MKLSQFVDVITPISIQAKWDDALAWIRQHNIDPNICDRIYIARHLPVAVFRCHAFDKDGMRMLNKAGTDLVYRYKFRWISDRPDRSVFDTGGAP